MNTPLRLVCSIAITMSFSVSSFAQRQTMLYIDNGSGGFTKITATGGPGTLNLPSSGTLLSNDSGQVIAGTFTLGIDGSVNPIAGQLNILDGGNTGDTAAFLWQSGALTLQFPSALPPSSGAGINLTAQTGFTGGGGISIAGGQAALSGSGGSVGIAGGNGAGPGGQASLVGGSGANADGGEVLVEGGNSAGSSGNGGEALVEGGNGNSGNSGTGGALVLSSGAGGGGTNGGNGGACTLSGGAGANGGANNGGNGGSLSISGGAGGTAGTNGSAGSNGSVSIQTSAGNTSIGNLGGTISIAGSNCTIDASGNVTATTYHGNGSSLTGISAFTPAYFNAYTTSVAVSIPAGGEIPVTTIAVNSGFTADGSGGYTVTATGVYNVEYTVARDESSSLAISVNGSVAANSVFGCATGTSVVHGNAMLSLTAGDKITLIASPNNSVSITLESVVTGTVEASLTATRIQ